MTHWKASLHVLRYLKSITIILIEYPQSLYKYSVMQMQIMDLIEMIKYLASAMSSCGMVGQFHGIATNNLQ